MNKTRKKVALRKGGRHVLDGAKKQDNKVQDRKMKQENDDADRA